MLELAIARALSNGFRPSARAGWRRSARTWSAGELRDRLAGARLGERLSRSDGPPRGEVTRLSQNRNVLAALLEAALAALYLEHGFEPIAQAIVEAFEAQIEFALTSQFDHKTDLQERLARTGASRQLHGARGGRARRTTGRSLPRR